MATVESIEFVEDLRDGPFGSQLLSKWTRPLRSSGRQITTAMQCAQPTLDEVINVDAIAALSPQSWFEQAGDMIAEKAGCGALVADKDMEKGPTNVPRQASDVKSS